MHIIKSNTLGIVFIGFGKIIVIIIKTEVTVAVNVSKGGVIVYQLGFCKNTATDE
jgi:hypothetical protein